MRRILSILLLLLILPISVHASDYTNKDYIHNERFDNSIIINGVDVSCYQDTSSDWKEAKRNGIDFAIFRVTLTKSISGTLALDDTFEEHFKKAGEAGMMRGVYAFSQAKNAEEGKAEAEFAVQRLKELGIQPEDLDLPVFMDYEFYHKENSRLSDLTREDAIEAAEAFCETIKDNGYKAGVYANTTFFASYLDNGSTLADDVCIWCAQYNGVNESGSDYSIWQYSSSATVPDIYEYGGKHLDDVDVNFWYVDTSLNKNSKIDIYGNTNVTYTGNPVYPELELYDGSKKLKEGKDYVVKGINNIEEGADAYAYVRGIGKYDGYALIPINIGTKFVKLDLPTSIINTSYKIKDNVINDIEDGITVKELLSNIELTTEEYRIGVIDAQGNELEENEEIIFSDMVGVFNDDTLVGTIDINLESEMQINYIFKK